MVNIAVVAMGDMGSAIASRLVRGGARVVTSLQGRSSTSAKRAARAGVLDATDEEIVRADYLLSVVPPAGAWETAQRWSQAAAGLGVRPIYVDCNAIGVQTSRSIGDMLHAVGARYIDACIIGFPGVAGDRGPAVYLAGEQPQDAAVLARLGLRVRSTGGEVGAASALKMAYAGLNKGLTGLAAAMALAAMRAGAGQALREEMADSQPMLLAHISAMLPDMYSKAWRWEFEMQEIARFAAQPREAGAIFDGLAGFYAQMGRDWAGAREQAKQIDQFLRGLENS